MSQNLELRVPYGLSVHGEDEIEAVDESAFTDESKDAGEEEQRSWKTWDEG